MSRTVELVGERLPGPMKDDTAKIERDAIVFLGHSFHRARDLDTNVREFVSPVAAHGRRLSQITTCAAEGQPLSASTPVLQARRDIARQFSGDSSDSRGDRRSRDNKSQCQIEQVQDELVRM